MSMWLTRTSIGESGSICASCNNGRVKDGNGRPTLLLETPLNELHMLRPEALTGHSLMLCDECLDDLRWVISPGVEENDD